MVTALVITFAVLAAISMPIAFAIGIACAVAIFLTGDVPPGAIPHKMVNGIDSYVFVAIPMFLLAGRLMNAGGITDRLFRFARVWAGSLTGGLAQANVLAAVLFAWMSGSAVATVGALGEIELKAMKENGYDVDFAAGLATASSVLGPIIPPSIPMIIYAAMTETSAGELFLGGIGPGLVMALGLMAIVYIMAVSRGYPKDRQSTFGEKILATRDAIIPLLMPVILIGGIVSGIFTPTEAAAVAAAYALVVSLFFYRTVKVKDLPGIFVETMVTTAVVTFIISMTSPFSLLLALENAGERIGGAINALSSNKYVILLLINLLLFVFGAIMEAGVVLILFIPILYPVATSAGIDPIHFGVIMCANLMVGVATPPVGMSLYVMSHISGLSIGAMTRAILPFLIPLIAGVLVITYIPGIVTWLPGVLMK